MERLHANEASCLKVLIADSDASVLRETNIALTSAGLEVAAAADAARALELLEQQRFDLLVLEAAMFAPDGAAVWGAIRGRARTPIIVSSSSAAEADVVRALELGADDYVTRPFKHGALLARIQAILRRVAADRAAKLTAGEITLDVAARRLARGGAVVTLTELETALMRLLLAAHGRAVSSERLALEVWGRAEPEQRHALKQVVYRLRRKLEREPGFAGRLESSRGAGYRWRNDGDSR